MRGICCSLNFTLCCLIGVERLEVSREIFMPVHAEALDTRNKLKKGSRVPFFMDFTARVFTRRVQRSFHCQPDEMMKARKLSARLVEAPTASCQRINRIYAIYALQRMSDGAVFTQRYEIKRDWEGRSEDVREILRRLMDVWTVQTNDFKVVYSTGRGLKRFSRP